MDLAVILLAAGQGTRMKSKHPKVLHELCGRPMVGYIADAAATLKPKHFIAVVSSAFKGEIEAALPDYAQAVVQKETLGTGDAVRTAAAALRDFDGTIVVLCGDTPLITGSTLRDLVKMHTDRAAAATVLTAKVDDPKGYGRIIRGAGGVKRIVEDRDASQTELCISEVNTGTYCFDARLLFAALEDITADNSQKEYYLTDAIGIFFDRSEKVVPCQAPDEIETMGINSRIQLADAEMIMQSRINRAHMTNGVTMVHPMLTYIDAGVRIGKDTIIQPNTFLKGNTVIGERCVLGPSSRITDTSVGNECEILFSVVAESELADRVAVGPFAQVRPGTKVDSGGKIGSFVETKNTSIGVDSKIPHLSYAGDTIIGRGVNVGAGTITCNFDGQEKHTTVIEDNAFIGSDTILVAPVKVGKRAYTGAGSVISKDVPDGALGIERTEQRTIEKWPQKSNKKAPGRRDT